MPTKYTEGKAGTLASGRLIPFVVPVGVGWGAFFVFLFLENLRYVPPCPEP